MYIFLRKILLKEGKERTPFGVPSDAQETEEVKGSWKDVDMALSVCM